MKTGRIKTNKLKALRKTDKIAFFICLGITLARVIASIQGSGDLLIAYYNIIKKYSTVLGIATIAFEFLWMFLMTAIPVLVIYLPYRVSRKKFLVKNTKYEIIENIEYYREFFQNISPAEISMVTDLEIETQKDISATLLKLYNEGYIDFEQEKLVVLHPADHQLKSTERHLLNLISSGALSRFDKSYWNRVAIDEAMQDGFIQINQEKPKKHFWGSTLLLLVAIGAVIYSSIFLFQGELFQQIDEYNANYDRVELEIFGEEDVKLSDIEKMTILSHDMEKQQKWEELNVMSFQLFQRIFIYVMMFALGLLIILVIPVYKLFRKIYYLSIEKSKYKRTAKGDELVEKLAAMQRYIHDFSLLSEAEKEQVRIWDDYLVYAIVLEENQEIVKDISKFKNIEIKQFCQPFNTETMKGENE